MPESRKGDHRRPQEPTGAKLGRELAALSSLIDRMHRADSLEEVYSCALDSIIDALACDRASLLLFDDQDVMQFVAWRGLSAGYRASAAGHSPWKRDEKNPVPLTVANAEEAGFEPSLMAVIESEGIRALGFIPLICDDALIGKFMIYFDAPHEFTGEEIDLALTIGRQLASGIEHKRAQEALVASEQSLRLALEAGRMGTWDWKVGTERLSWSESLEKIYGLEPGSFPGTFEGYRNCIHPDDWDASRATIEESLASRDEHEVEHRVVWPDGSVHWVEGRGRVIRDHNGVPVRMVGVATDITKRKKAEQDMRFLADVSASLAAVSEDVVTLQKLAHLAVPVFADWCAVDLIETDSLTRIAVAHVDPAKVELARDIQSRYPADPDKEKGVWQIASTGKSHLIAEITDELLASLIADPDLRAVLADLGLKSYIGVPLIVRGRVIAVVSFIAAESGRRYDAEDLALAEDLAQRTAVAIENAKLYQELREADRRKDTFLATLAHELRNPLAPMGYALRIMELAEGDRDALRDARATIDRQLGHMVRLVDDLLDVSRITQDKIQLQPTWVDLGSVIQQAVEAAEPFVASSRHVMDIHLPEEPIYLHGDATRLAQVFSNLLNNSSKFTNAGGRIRISAEQEEGFVSVTIKDNGIGIAPEAMATIFDMFAQADNSLGHMQSGLGIGLTLAKRLVELHGGSISVSSDGIGHGSEFMVRLPNVVQAPPGFCGEAANGHVSASMGRRRVLVVDDNQDAAKLLSKMLEMLGHQTELALDGPTALTVAEDFKPDIVLMDIGLPGLSGYQVAESLRNCTWGKDLLLVAITGWGQTEDRLRSKAAGFDHHLVKPVSFDALSDLLGENVPREAAFP